MSRKRNRVQLNCFSCSKPFEIIKARVKVNRKNFCSVLCRNKQCGLERRLYKYPKKVGECFYCKKDIIAKNASFDKPNRKFCSKTCKIIWANKNIPYSAARRKKIGDRSRILFQGMNRTKEHIEKQRHTIMGKGHWNWQGGKTGLIRLIRNLFEMKSWRKSVFERDNYTCVWCGAKNGNGKAVILNADHIKQFSILIKENNIDSIEKALNCKELWNINNGRTLCLDCHKKTDSFASKGIKRSL
jgi:hypothetical protein